MAECGVNSLVCNTFINKKIEMKNLEFGIDEETNIAKKCRQMHVGKQNSFCPPLKAHKAKIMKVDHEKYLGDVISNDGKLSKTIQQRISKGTGKISQIMTILKTVSLGHHYFPMAILLRNLLFVNAILVNSEVWYPLKESDLDQLEVIDRRLMRKLIDTPDGTPNELLYLELGCIPLKEIVKCRRLNFLHDLLTGKEDELIVRFFRAQLRNPSTGDWTEIVKNDLKDFQINETFSRRPCASKS